MARSNMRCPSRTGNGNNDCCRQQASLAFYRAAALSAEQNRALSRDRKLTMPVLGLSADQGAIPDVSAAPRPFATDVRGETVAHCGHFQPEEQPEAVADALARFFASCSS